MTIDELRALPVGTSLRCQGGRGGCSDRDTQGGHRQRHDVVPQTCLTCHGMGRVYDPLCERWRPCQDCSGMGFVSVRKG